MKRTPLTILIASLALSSVSSNIMADPGKPVAVRWWGQAMVSIETYWNLQIVIDPFGEQVGYKDPHVSADLVLITHEHFDHNNARLVGGEPIVVHALDSEGKVVPGRQVLDRLPNKDKPTWSDADADANRSTHKVAVTTIPAWHDEQQGRQRGATAMFAIDVDGVRIVHCGDLGQAKLTDEQLAAIGRVDVLLIPAGGVYTIDTAGAVGIVEQVRPRYVIPIHYKTPALKINLEGIEPFIAVVRNRFELVRAKGNTLAVSAANPEAGASTRVVVLDYEPWKLGGELAEMFARKEAASRAAQQVFVPLSVDQMNLRPSNGTHTPRWNAEHMMGRELLFFTQIYTARDPQISQIDLNPAQMPPDYKAAHPDWTGAEEARQMERVEALVRRFAYLLDGVDLDERAPGSRWTLRRLFQQMENHYAEHTENVKKKFELPDWPRE
jgi:L-ascorbate metabolism protein UlaG (beta-lactamase superfamily)